MINTSYKWRMVAKILSLSLLLTFYSCKNEKNVENIKLVDIHMSIDEVKKIMGEPDSTFKFPNEYDQFRFMYHAPLGASDNVYVIFSSRDSLVISKNDGM